MTTLNEQGGADRIVTLRNILYFSKDLDKASEKQLDISCHHCTTNRPEEILVPKLEILEVGEIHYASKDKL